MSKEPCCSLAPFDTRWYNHYWILLWVSRGRVDATADCFCGEGVIPEGCFAVLTNRQDIRNVAIIAAR